MGVKSRLGVPIEKEIGMARKNRLVSECISSMYCFLGI